jgi:transposase InsO family protein
VPLTRFTEVHVDLVGPLPTTAGGYQYLLKAINRSTRWAEAMPLKTVSTADCAAAFIAGWVSRFGIPAALISDRGVQFTSSMWAAVMQQLGVKHKMATAFHPQSNGMIERFHRRLKEALKARAASSDWDKHLPWVMLGVSMAPREDSAISTAELVYGAALAAPAQFITTARPPPEAFVQQLQAAPHVQRPTDIPAWRRS